MIYRHVWAMFIISLMISGCTINQPPYVILPDGSYKYTYDLDDVVVIERQAEAYQSYFRARLGYLMWTAKSLEGQVTWAKGHIVVKVGRSGKVKELVIPNKSFMGNPEVEAMITSLVKSPKIFRPFPDLLGRKYRDREYILQIVYLAFGKKKAALVNVSLLPKLPSFCRVNAIKDGSVFVEKLYDSHLISKINSAIQNAYRNSSIQEEGPLVVDFEIAPDGRIISAQADEGQSIQNPEIKKIVEAAFKEIDSQFPFPQEMKAKYPTESFNIKFYLIRAQVTGTQDTTNENGR